MSNLNKIALLIYIVPKTELGPQIERALDSWNRRKDTKDFVPDSIIFSNDQLDITTDPKLYELEVKFRKDVRPNFFKIEGSTL